jgi:hypothetical protein
MVIPEATVERIAAITKEWNKPPFMDYYVSMDIGFVDFTAILIGYWDFANAKLIIEDEIMIKGTKVTTRLISEAIKEREKAIMGWQKPYLRVADNNNLILLNELAQAPYNLTFMATAKDQKEAAINKVRLMVHSEQIIINPRCKNLLNQLRYATWNKHRSDFDRDPSNGHYDLLASLIYLVRNVHQTKNPYPDNYLMIGDYATMHKQNLVTDPFQKDFQKLFNPFKFNKSQR